MLFRDGVLGAKTAEGLRMRRTAFYTTILGFVAGIIAAGVVGEARADELGPFGPPLGVKADVVRTFTMKTSGAVAKNVKGSKGDGETGLRGQCNPKMFANFSIEKGSMFGEQAEIAIVTVDPISTGATGNFKLSKIWVRFFDDANMERKFGGPGLLKLTVHQAAAGKRRMTGTISGSKLEGLGKQDGKKLDVTASFDMDFSCGVK